MNTSPLVSIITPMYKGAELVGQTIESVQAQTFADWELIIVDDCSPDDGAGAAAVRKYADADRRIRLICAKENKGSSGARNRAMREACGRYFAFLDSDDIWHPDYLAVMLKHIAENTEAYAAVFYCGYRRMDSRCEKEVLAPYRAPGKKDFKKLLFHCPIFPSAAIVDTQKLQEPVYFREELKALRDDYVYWLDVLRQGLCAVGYADILVDYRMRDDSVTASKTQMIRPQWRIYRDVLGFGVFRSLFYIFTWGINGLKKYKRPMQRIRGGVVGDAVVSILRISISNRTYDIRSVRTPVLRERMHFLCA